MFTDTPLCCQLHHDGGVHCVLLSRANRRYLQSETHNNSIQAVYMISLIELCASASVCANMRSRNSPRMPRLLPGHNEGAV